MPLPLVLGAPALLAGAAGFLGASFLQPVTRIVSHESNLFYPNEVLDIGSNIRLMWTHQNIFNRLRHDMRQLGFNDQRVQDFLNASIRWPTVDEILQLILLGKISETDPILFRDTNGIERKLTLEQLFNSAQVPKELADTYLKLRERPLPLGTSLAMFRRFGNYADITDEKGAVHRALNPVGGRFLPQYKESLKAEGFERFPDTDIFDAFRQFPGVADLIRFAVREVFTPEIAERFGAFDEFPDDFRDEARKAGLSDEHTRMYWGAHWDLPSITQGFQMFQRRIISEEELKLLLRAQDVQPFWRDKLIAMSHRVLRIVDIDRMYEQRVIPKLNHGNLTPDEPLIKEFMIRGYNFDNAKNRAIWLDRTRHDPATEATIKSASKSFRFSFIDLNQFKSILTALDLPGETENFILQAASAEREQRRISNTIKRLRPLLLDGTVSQREFIENLSKFNLTEESIRDIIEDIEAERGTNTKGLTESQILRLYKGDYIKTKREAIDLLIRSGRSPRAAFVLIEEADDDKRTGAASVPFDDMKGFFSDGHVDEILFRDYLKAKGIPLFAENAYVDSLAPNPSGGVIT